MSLAREMARLAMATRPSGRATKRRAAAAWRVPGGLAFVALVTTGSSARRVDAT